MSSATARPTVHRVDVEVRYAETDQMGVVHHANYIVWFELARTGLCATTGWHYAEIEKLGYLLMVTGVEVKYRQAARYGDRISVSCALERLASRALAFSYRVERADALLATGRTDHLWVEAASGRPCRTPEPLREPFARLTGAP
ncbi:MAG: thioesterase family protein [Acidobacteriota bacterium]